MRKLILAASLAVSATTASAIPPVPPPPAPAPPPRLLVVISVDQLSSDLFEQYRPHFTGGLARLARGTVFANGYHGHASTQTCPGHAAVMTGTHPATNGMIANYWYDFDLPRRDKRVYCAEDPRAPGSTSSDYRVSAFHLKAPTLGDVLKQHQPQSMNVAVAGKDRAAVMMSGRRVDQRWYWSGRRFETDLENVPAPRSAVAANTAVTAMIATADRGLAPPPVCAAKARPVAIGRRSVGEGRLARQAGDRALFRASPAFDGAVLALSAALVQEMRLGSDTAPDILSIGLSASDYVGHRFGSGGQEMCLQLLSLDRDLGDFLQFLDRSGLDYAVALTSDHGVADVPERAGGQGPSGAERVDPALEATALGKAIARKLNLRGPVLVGGYDGDIYVSQDLPAADRDRVLNEARAFYRAHPQVEAALTAAELAAMAIPSGSPDRWSLAERARASFDPERSGDLVVLLRSHVMPIPPRSGGSVATHGSAWDHDRRVPIIFWRRGIGNSERPEPVSTVDVMPTLASMLDLPPPAGVDGKCLTGIQGIACPQR